MTVSAGMDLGVLVCIHVCVLNVSLSVMFMSASVPAQLSFMELETISCAPTVSV